jgi:hypothetical protein
MFDTTQYDAVLEQALQEIEAALRPEPRAPGWITVQEYAQAEGLTIPQARRDLEKGLSDGKLLKDRRKIGRQWLVVYKVKSPGM